MHVNGLPLYHAPTGCPVRRNRETLEVQRDRPVMAAADQIIIVPKQNHRVVCAAENRRAFSNEVERSGGFLWTCCDRL